MTTLDGTNRTVVFYRRKTELDDIQVEKYKNRIQVYERRLSTIRIRICLISRKVRSRGDPLVFRRLVETSSSVLRCFARTVGKLPNRSAMRAPKSANYRLPVSASKERTLSRLNADGRLCQGAESFLWRSSRSIGVGLPQFLVCANR